MINAFKAVGNDGTGQKWLKVQAVMAASGLLPAGGAAACPMKRAEGSRNGIKNGIITQRRKALHNRKTA